MGQDESTPVDESVAPRTLAGRSIEALAAYLTHGKPQVVVMTGAGISTSAGIPDFRSPETGLYANLARLDLPHAEAVFDIAYFRENPKPFYTLARELYPGRYRPTITHSFIRLLHDKGLLLREFTQNIDCLSREAGVPGERIVEAHGSFARQGCIDCAAPYPDDAIRRHVAAMTIPRCERCGGLVKPAIVFFGEQLPPEFFEARHVPAEADLCLVMGTSLTVQPFASLPGLVRDGAPRVLVNLERVGGMGSRPDDVLILGDCDQGVRKLAAACGWLDELEALWAATASQGKAGPADGKTTTDKAADESLEDEVEKLTREVEQTLSLSKQHEEKTRGELQASGKAISEAKPTCGTTDESSVNDASKATDTKKTAKTPFSDDGGNLNHIFLTGPKTEAAGSKPDGGSKI